MYINRFSNVSDLLRHFRLFFAFRLSMFNYCHPLTFSTI